MPDPTSRELKLIQYLNEAYGKEKQLEVLLQAQIGLAQKAPLKKRLQEHLRETKAQSKNLERRIKALGGKAEAVDLPGPDAVSNALSGASNLANKALAAAKGPIQTLRGTSAADNQLRNVRDAYWNEAEEIAHYNTIEAFADKLGDKETVKLAKEHRRQEERMQKFLAGQIPSLVGDVIRSEIPAKERNPGGTTRRRSTRRRSTSRSTSAKRAAAGAKGGRKTAAKSATKSTARAKAGAKGGRKTAAKRSSSASSSRSTRGRTSANGASASGSRSRSGSRAKSS
jgi:ferritin-like metal-binding protein YciE